MISLVDDDPDTLNATASLIRSLGYEVMTFESGRIFLDWNGLPETWCVITDLVMPEIDGIELQRLLKLKGFRMPIIILTATTDDAVRRRLMLDGAHEILTKPCTETV